MKCRAHVRGGGGIDKLKRQKGRRAKSGAVDPFIGNVESVQMPSFLV